MWQDEKCYACGRAIKGTACKVRVAGETTTVYVGPDCYRKIREAGDIGYQPKQGGPRLVSLATVRARA